MSLLLFPTSDSRLYVWGKVDVATDTTSTIGNEEEGGLACFRGTAPTSKVQPQAPVIDESSPLPNVRMMLLKDGASKTGQDFMCGGRWM
jgi:hypothetical protein